MAIICTHSKYATVLSDSNYLVMYKTTATLFSLQVDENEKKYSSIKLLSLKINCFLNNYASGLIKG